MRKQRLLLGALIFSVSSWVSASVPIIKLSESQRAEINSQVAFNNTYFGIKDNSKLVETNAGNGMRNLESVPVSPLAFGFLPGILTQVGSKSTLTDHKVIDGSFSSYLRGTSSSFGTSVSDVNSGNTEPRYDSMVASSPALKSWAVLLLGIGCVIYLGSRRQHPFGYRKLN